MKFNMKGGVDINITENDQKIFDKLYYQFEKSRNIKSSDLEKVMFNDLGLNKEDIEKTFYNPNPFKEIDESQEIFSSKFKELVISVNNIILDSKSINEVKYILLNNILPKNCRSGAGFKNRLKLYLIELYKICLINHYILYFYLNSILINIIRNIGSCDTGPFESVIPRYVRGILHDIKTVPGTTASSIVASILPKNTSKKQSDFSKNLPGDDNVNPSFLERIGAQSRNIPTADEVITRPLQSLVKLGKTVTGTISEEQNVRQEFIREDVMIPPLITKQIYELKSAPDASKIEEEINSEIRQLKNENTTDEKKDKTNLYLSSLFSSIRQKSITLIKCYNSNNVSLLDTATDAEDGNIEEALKKKDALNSMNKSLNTEFSHIQTTQQTYSSHNLHNYSSFLLSAGAAGVTLLTAGADMGSVAIAAFLLNVLLKSDTYAALRDSKQITTNFQKSITDFNDKIKKTVIRVKECKQNDIYRLFQESNLILEAYCAISKKYYDDYLIKYNYFFQIYMMLCKDVKLPDINYEDVKTKITDCFTNLKKKIQDNFNSSPSYNEMDKKIKFIIEKYNELDEEQKIMLINNISKTDKWKSDSSSIVCKKGPTEGEILGTLNSYINEIITVLNIPDPFINNQQVPPQQVATQEVPPQQAATQEDSQQQDYIKQMLKEIKRIAPTFLIDKPMFEIFYNRFNSKSEKDKLQILSQFLQQNSNFDINNPSDLKEMFEMFEKQMLEEINRIASTFSIENPMFENYYRRYNSTSEEDKLQILSQILKQKPNFDINNLSNLEEIFKKQMLEEIKRIAPTFIKTNSSLGYYYRKYNSKTEEEKLQILSQFLEQNPDFNINDQSKLIEMFKINLTGQTYDQAVQMMKNINNEMKTKTGITILQNAYKVFNSKREESRIAILEKFPSNFDITIDSNLNKIFLTDEDSSPIFGGKKTKTRTKLLNKKTKRFIKNKIQKYKRKKTQKRRKRTHRRR